MHASELSEAGTLLLLRQLAGDYFGLQVARHRVLPGELDLNFYLETEQGQAYVLKIVHPQAREEEIELQNALLAHLAERRHQLELPRPASTLEGGWTARIDFQGQSRFLRLLHWAPGRLMAEVNPQNEAFLASLGQALGQLSAALDGFDHPAAHRWIKWDPAQADWAGERLDAISEPGRRALAEHFFKLFEQEIKPHLAQLRYGVNYNDANDYNVLVTGPAGEARVSGFIDFGDAVYTPLVNELAIALAYALLDKPDPLAASLAVVRAYHEVFPLKELELQVLFPLIGARLLLSVVNSAINRVAEPENEYLLISERPAWDLLERLGAIPPALAHYAFRWACGLEPCPGAADFAHWTQGKSFAPIVGVDLNGPEVFPLDLGVGSLELGNNREFEEIEGFERRIGEFLRGKSEVGSRKSEGGDGETWRGGDLERGRLGELEMRSGKSEGGSRKWEGGDLEKGRWGEGVMGRNGKSEIGSRKSEIGNGAIGIGGYGETRPFYTTDAYTIMGNEGPMWRTVHLGIDLWMPAETPVYAPLEGVVFSVQDNAGERDYGPTIILEHQMELEDGRKRNFYTLYGHLSRRSLEGLEEGMAIARGQRIAWIGPRPENGNWPPHLHFQVMLDRLGWKGDFPGVAYPHMKDLWLSICPDPTLLLNRPPVPPAELFTTEELLQKRRRHLGPNLSVSYRRPLHIVRGYRQYLYDESGRRYLDTVNNVAHVGHQHPRVVEAIQRQAAVLNTNTRYLHREIVAFAEELLATLPPAFEVVYLVNSGSEANELALRMARTATGRRDMVAIQIGYHGNTNATIDVSSYKFDRKGGRGAPPTTHIVPMPDPYRGPYKADDPRAGVKYAAFVGAVIARLSDLGREIAGFIGETILSCGGQIVPPAGYLESIYRQVRAAGGLCIADEVQTGFGRVGEHFWSFEMQGVVPDIVTMGKPIGNGHPLGAVAATRAVAEAFHNGMEYFNTFGGNPVSCAAGRAVLAVIEEEGLQQNALETGRYLRERLLDLQSRFSIIGEVRGPGLFQGFELITDPESLNPATAQASYLANRMRERGLLMSTDGPYENVLKIKPPMCFSPQNVDFLCEQLEVVLGEEAMR